MTIWDRFSMRLFDNFEKGNLMSFNRLQNGVITCRVAGVTFENRQRVLRQIATNQSEWSVACQAEPDNPHDSDAIKVLAYHFEKGEHHIGYLPYDLAEWLSEQQPPVKIFKTWIVDVGNSADEIIGIGIALELASV